MTSNFAFETDAVQRCALHGAAQRERYIARMDWLTSVRDFFEWMLQRSVGKFLLGALIALPVLAFVGYSAAIGKRKNKVDDAWVGTVTCKSN